MKTSCGHSSYHAPLFRMAHRHRLTTQLGIVALFYGCVEGVHINMYNLPSGHLQLTTDAKIH